MHGPSVSIVWDDRFREYDFGPGHPFSEIPRYLAVQLLRATTRDGAAAQPRARWVDAISPASREELARFHQAEYLDLVERASGHSRRVLLDRGDTPSFPGCYEASGRIVGGLLSALRAAEESHAPAFHPAGGLHHAHPFTASGFCIFNDLAVAIASLRDRAPNLRIAYVDIDAHHGDGVMYGFYDDGHLLDIDFHQDGRSLFPGTGSIDETGRADGAGLKVNVPLPPGAGDEAFVPLFSRLVPPLLDEFQPDVILLQHGVDGHAGDRLAQLQYTRLSYHLALTTLRGYAREGSGVTLVVTGGGGYSPSHVACRLAEVGLGLLHSGHLPAASADLPAEWRTEFEALTGEKSPAVWDRPGPVSPSPWSEERTERLAGELGRALGREFPASSAR